ncbi:MAG: gamma-glutamyltransferase [Gammaproteobacteria bacterium]
MRNSPVFITTLKHDRPARRLTKTVCRLWLLLLLPWPVHADSPAEAAIASAQPLATAVGINILAAGGNAFDAAIAVTATLAVVEPYSSGIGGGGFYLLHRARDNHQIMLDARETAPRLTRQRDFLDTAGNLDRNISINSALAAGIPGIPAALEHLASRYGRLPLQTTLAPAIEYAREGFPVTERYRRLAGYRLEVLRRDPETAKVFLHNNDIPPPGHVIKQPALAATLMTIADQGAAGFYQGKLADRLAQSVTLAGGHWTREDLLEYRVIERAPIVTQYHNIRIVSAPPPSSGGIVMGQALNILEQFDLSGLDSVGRKHLVVEAMKRAYRDRAVYLGDSDFVDVPVTRLLDKRYAEGLALGIDPQRATPSAELPPGEASVGIGEDTTHFSILDRDGNRVAATLSINLPFGTGILAGDTGVLLNNELDDFALKPSAPNAYGLVGDEANKIEPGKRPLSSMTPTFLETADKVAILGTPGGSRIISMVMLGALEFANGGLPREWVATPRYHHQYLPDVIQHEPAALTAAEQSGLKSLGHELSDIGRMYGNMQAILWHKPTNLVFAASDPRGEGSAEKAP